MPYVAKKIADVGTENPIVARLTFQWLEIFRWFDVPAHRKNAVFEIMMHKVQPRVVECERISLSMRADVEAAMKTGVTIGANGRVVSIPEILRAKERAEDYLADARMALRDFGGVFLPLLGSSAPHTNFAAIAKWAGESFGEDDPLAKFVRRSNEEWIRKLCAMRDVVEHPDSEKGPFLISGLRFDQSDPNNIILYEPFWSLKNEKARPIVADMQYYNRKLLTFFEEALMAALKNVRMHVRVSFADIEEKDRSPEAPIRFKAVYDVGGAVVPAGTITENQVVVPELQRMLQQGRGRRIIAQRFQGQWWVAAGQKLYPSSKWKTFHDFLFAYIKDVLGGPWANLDLKKPRAERHPLMNWYQDVTIYMNARIKVPGTPAGAPMTSLAGAYLGLSYNLYLISHNNGSVHELLVRRLKNRDNFFGAYYETVAAGIMIRAGFDLEPEDEADSTTSHCEFTATHRASGQKFSVEAKIRLSTKEIPDISRQLARALTKRAAHARVVFIEVNTVIDGEPENILEMMRVLLKDVRDLEATLKVGPDNSEAPPAYLVITNNPPGTVDTPYRPAVMVEGFKMPDFRVENMHASLREALKAREKHVAMYDLVESLREHVRIPSTFDGDIPGLAFRDSKDRLVIGRQYRLASPEGEVCGELVQAVVLADQRKAYCIIATDSGKAQIVACDLTEDEMSAYCESPRTFFGRLQQQGGPITDGLKLYDQIHGTYKASSKDQLLSFMSGHFDLVNLKSKTQEELAAVYAETITESIFRDAASRTPKGA